MHDTNDTIAAMATSPGESGIGIIRVSGPRAIAVADAVFSAASRRPCAKFRSFTVHYGNVVRRRPGAADETVDEALLTVMRAPRSYTKEDVVEISCHGGTVAMRAVLELVLESGCRLAEPGEFTRRAFLNGRIDLSQAEAVLDVIRAKTDAALRTGVAQLRGELRKSLEPVREALLGCLARLESSIDFPEDDPRRDEGYPELDGALGALEKLLLEAGRGRVYREGLQAVICGKPNAGKSSLLNALLKEERSIVTPVAGTTRDTIEEVIDIRGIPVRIVDTAGILEPRDLVEKKAVRRTNERIASADIVILVFDAGKKLDGRDELLMRRLPARRRVIPVVNKIDRKQVIALGPIRKRFGEPVMLSARLRKNIAGLEEAIGRAAGCAHPGPPSVLSNLRHIQALKKVKKIIEATRDSRDNKLPPECAAQNLKDACRLLDSVQGRDFSEDLLERIFGEFCIGK